MNQGSASVPQDPGILFLGCGAISHRHVKHLAQFLPPSWKFFGVARSQVSLDKFSRAAGARLGKLITAQNFKPSDARAFKAVVICLPPADHISALRSLLPLGVPILIEKPAICSGSELEEVDRLVAQPGSGSLLVAENYDFKPSTNVLLSLIRESRMGRLTGIRLRKETLQEARTWKTQCGALFEGGIHFVSLGHFLAGSGPDLSSIDILEWRANAEGIERGSRVRWRCLNGVDIELTYAWDRRSRTFGLGQKSELIFERGTVAFESNGLWISGAGLQLKDPSGAQSQAQAFAQFLLDAKPFSSTWAKSRGDLALTFSAYLKTGTSPLNDKEVTRGSQKTTPL